MFIKNFDFNEFIQSGLNILLTLAFGVLMVGSALFALKEFGTYRTNVEQVAAIDVVEKGRVHILDVPGVAVKCFILDAPSGQTMRVIGSNAKGLAACDSIKDETGSWKSHGVERKSNSISLVGGITLTLVMFISAAAWVSIPLLILVWLTRSEWLYENVKILALVLALPALIYFGGFTLGTTFNAPVKMWLHNGAPVHTHEVLVDKDGKIYRAPESVYHWTDPYVGRLVTKITF